MTLNLPVTFYFAMLVVLPMKVYKTNLVTCHLIPVVMTSFNTAASLLLEPLINISSNNMSHPVQDKLPH